MQYIELIFYHASRQMSRDRILKNGLLRNQVHSGYGKKPIHNAIYLFHENNIDVPCDFIDLFGMVDIYRVRIPDPNRLLPDEDSKETTWRASLEKMGTVAYAGDIKPKYITYLGRFYDCDSIEKLFRDIRAKKI